MYREHHRRYRQPLFQHQHPWKRRFLTKEEKKEMGERFQEKLLKRIERYKEFLEKELAGKVARVEMVGDCFAPRSLQHAILEGHQVAREI